MAEKEVYKVWENAITGYLLTVKIVGEDLSFNHQTMHAKDEFETFDSSDIGIEIVNGVKLYHVNGKILNLEEFDFLNRIIEDL